MDPSVPLLWRMDKDVAGSGVTGDLAFPHRRSLQFLVGEITPSPAPAVFSCPSASVPTAAKPRSRSRTPPSSSCKYGDGAIGHFEATRFANGRKNANTFEVNGELRQPVFQPRRHVAPLVFRFAASPSTFRAGAKSPCGKRCIPT